MPDGTGQGRPEDDRDEAPAASGEAGEAEGGTRRFSCQVFEAFDLQITYDKAARRVEISATVSEAVAETFENAKALRLEGSQVVIEDMAGAGFEPATFGL